MAMITDFIQHLFNNNFTRLLTPPMLRAPSIRHLASSHGFIANKWQPLMGENNWEGLLDPLDKDLRETLIHYGEMSQATYDTFIRDKYSKYAGGSRFSRKNFFSKVCLEEGHPYKYRVTKFFYSTSVVEMPNAFIFKSLVDQPWFKDTNFMGYIAVAEDETVKLLGRREIVVAWRGSVEFLEWWDNFKFAQVSGSSFLGDQGDDGEPMVHRGWYSIYTTDNPQSTFAKTSVRDQVLTEVRRLMDQYKGEEISITVTGHSLGAALATLNAVDIVANKVNHPTQSPNAKPYMVTAIVFASPRLGDANFKKLASKYNDLRILRVKNALDVVPRHPSINYVDVGEELRIDTTKSPYIKNPGLPSASHNLEVYMHGIAGVQGNNQGFNLDVERDITLINKYNDFLKDDYLVPVNWFVQKYKGMVHQSDGSWILMDHEVDEDA